MVYFCIINKEIQPQEDFIIPVSGIPYAVKDGVYPPNLNPHTLEVTGDGDFIIPLTKKLDFFHWANGTTIMRCLSGRQKDILELRFGKGQSQNTVARSFGTSREYVRDQEKASLEHIREYIDWNIR